MRLPAGCRVSDAASDPLAARVFPEPTHPYRTSFQRDRGRIIHARAFRRLAGKTQVFTHRYSDHFRSRLTHTMEVAQIARTVAATLGLNEDLTETLALVHDIGHPPFGHAGERALDDALRAHGLRFDHNLHALRIVEHFELRYAGFRGLNLTLAVREGIIKHSRDYSAAEHPELREYLLDQRPPLEAQIIDLADEIAYLTADLDDGMEAEILNLEDIRRNVQLFERFFVPMGAKYPDAPAKLVFNEALKRVLNALVDDLIAETCRQVKAANATTLEGIRNAPHRLAAFSSEMETLRLEAKQYLYTHLYNCAELTHDHKEAARVITELFEAWTSDPSLLPATYASRVIEEGAPRVVADYIAGMTDNFILAQYAAFQRSRSDGKRQVASLGHISRGIAVKSP
ncbi:dNTP triphosphohydrolase [Alloacidobacterium dinghuense]|uniref:Deoxyguanosinetriphosphate triphosphohydrolase-like protein n=1 Tax=Alloacidobacterium dinghuense TaxID=2763107 RepID=A0A7G8BJC9_9BACT|nr:dNTP triphosphohydrolase [Alloacidobacterium dinghuense]QNI32649.1 dNTP triphosphohydrolase [Alloacidobacterium dinghuense]